MRAKRFLWFIIPIFAGILFLATKRDFDRAGVSGIEKLVGFELSGVISNTPSLSIYRVGERESFELIGDKPPYKGKIWYVTTLNGESGDLVVYWEGSSNACRIDKIAVVSTQQSERVVWSPSSK